jgi:hypothetical protein
LHVTIYSEEQRDDSPLARAIHLYRDHGVDRLLTGVADFFRWRWRTFVLNRIHVWYFNRFKQETFTFGGSAYEYFYHRYNETQRNERAVEVPIVYDEVSRHIDGSVLEVGNVLSHYFDCSHAVVDRYECGQGVINEDIVDYRPDQEFDLVASISTLEHVGWDEEAADPEKVLGAFDTIRALLADDGHAVITFPVGYNPFLDEQIRSDRLFTEKRLLKRVSRDNRWKEVDSVDVDGAEFGDPYEGANELLVGYIRK